MKNWKYIDGAEVGNIDVSTNRLKDIEEQIKNWEHAINKVEGIDKEKAKKILEDLRKERAELRSQTGNETMHEWATSKPKNVGNTKVINSDREFFKDLADDAKEREDKDKQEVEKLAGNARYTLKEDVISHLDTDLYDICKKVPAGSPSLAYVRELQKIGWDISTISKYNSEIGKIIDKYKKVGNSKAGNYTRHSDYNSALRSLDFWEKAQREAEKSNRRAAPVRDTLGIYKVDETYYVMTEGEASSKGWTKYEVHNKKTSNSASEYEILKQDPSKMHPMYKKAYEEAMKKLAREDEEFKRRFEKEYGVKAKNETSDDKFAYVMREFDEGKLKTPDGKVVTDPAQAKAIAYSESKKAENGLARARNAIKK